MRLMVVDDDVSVCRVLQFILKSMGHDCEWLRHPEGALTSLLSRYDD